MAQSSFYHYNPESAADRQHLFTPQPSAILPSSPMPTHGMSHPSMYMYPQMMSQIVAPQPQQMYKPTMFTAEPHILSLDTECSSEEFGNPGTPGLSASSSIMSSPPSISQLSSPINLYYLGEQNIHGVKEGCEMDVKSEILASIDWTRCGSPPLTPGTFMMNRGLS